ncbi:MULTISPECIES: UDP-3-O-(3-hydroxymyristoyl)glucosamine N-acyltransferase [Mesonia]|uniref:UDP-3-O-acylglucosamine N-acyltransferase n=1 Tax=Mesonia oceanica TaxID=2687242 RepID=A0AC61YC92_9FLAO|nr:MULTISPECIES: UDP-3-O-(3-hydroxymyristoyl)glucosamine N-acyltransferase [Mesonia]MAN27128.1 UDP-3-O-(3-hydroxymyristoyl)glucosamine N-acyltransferase [Mesonia sp.]MAQ42015.1 UDP-3-O-(3-hydroxymyristoyl)glucosamine N-acyltransferase [Mesonia sp.]MBJ97630.1 UDP-3-O-(3-hydroxymyristoyl)glucosamine N-acyltransferase [Flavobacteriaceae bacterium]VVV02116.1 UDP-3-O-acylglucosamine N-acyltransferase [Mesonia oceanica]|tara:strand:+ start:38213 stop:39145 length:933 start_codon:yes stop_codon:yes gene_type:complete
MKFPQTHTLQQIATIINAEFVGDSDFPVEGMNEIHVVTPGDIVFVDHPKYYDKALQSAATIILINKEVACPEGKALLISDDPFRDFNKLTDYFKPFQKSLENISSSAEIGENTVIQPNSFIGNHVKIGKNCLIHSNVSIYDHTLIGDNVTIHAGTVLGASAFYYKNRPEGFDQLKSGGRVIIENNVDIGAACTIDRGVSGDTTIKEGTKIDNQVHIGHDTVIGKKCLIASQVGIAGCVILEDEVTLWGQVGVRSDVRLAKGSEVFAQSGVGKNLKPNTQYFGSPATEAKKWFKEAAAIRQLPSMLNKKSK